MAVRVYTVLEDDIAKAVEVEATKIGTTRSSWIAEAVTTRLRHDKDGGDDLAKLNDDLRKANDDLTKG